MIINSIINASVNLCYEKFIKIFSKKNIYRSFVYDKRLIKEITELQLEIDNIDIKKFSYEYKQFEYIIQKHKKLNKIINNDRKKILLDECYDASKQFYNSMRESIDKKYIVYISKVSKMISTRLTLSDNTYLKEKIVISSLFLKNKLKCIYKAYISLVVSVLLTLVISCFTNINTNIYWGFIGYFIILSIYYLVIKYRVERGVFGTNMYEAKELLTFILKNSNDFNNGNGEKIFCEEKLSELIIDMNSRLGLKEV